MARLHPLIRLLFLNPFCLLSPNALIPSSPNLA